jgi:hypothetical protein
VEDGESRQARERLVLRHARSEADLPPAINIG